MIHHGIFFFFKVYLFLPFCFPQCPSGLPRNLEGALQRYGSSSYKANAITVLDANGKPSHNLTYGKLLSRTQKIAYSLLCKVGQKGDPIRTGDRVLLVSLSSDSLHCQQFYPLPLIIAFLSFRQPHLAFLITFSTCLMFVTLEF